MIYKVEYSKAADKTLRKWKKSNPVLFKKAPRFFLTSCSIHYQNQYITIIQLGLVMILLMKKMDTMSYWCLSTRRLLRLSKGFTTVMSSEQSGEHRVTVSSSILNKNGISYYLSDN